MWRTLAISLSVLLAGCGTATHTQSSSSERKVVSPYPQVDLPQSQLSIRIDPTTNQTVVIMAPREYVPTPPSPRPYYHSEAVPRSNGEVVHTYNGRVTHIERPSWTQKR